MRRFGFLVLLSVAACTPPDAALPAVSHPPPPSPTPSSNPALAPLHVEDGFFRTPDGRAVILHGLNYSHRMKTPPYATWQSEGHFEQMAGWGFNFVRYTIFWEGLEPFPGQIDTDYLGQIEEAVGWASDHGLYVLIDMHQDLYSRHFGGSGAPEWALIDNPLVPNPKLEPWFLNYYNPDVIASFDNFFGSAEMRTHYRDVWLAVVERVRGFPNIVGYDLMNEPWTGSALVWDFEEEVLAPFFDELAASIATIDPDRPAFWGPLQLEINSGGDSRLPVPARPSVYAPHYYDAAMETGTPYDGKPERIDAALTRMADRGAEWSGATVLTEFGPRLTQAGALDYLEDVLQAAETSRLAGWAHWNYNPQPHINDPIEEEERSVIEADGSEADALDHLVRPRPAELLGTPTEIRFDTVTKTFTLRWTGPAGSSRIFLPQRHYPDHPRILEVTVDDDDAVHELVVTP